MNRRTAIQRIGLVLGASISAPTAGALLSGCRTPSPDGYAPRTLDATSFGHLAEVAEVILPATDTPGAREAGVHRFIDAMLADYYPADEAGAFTQALVPLLEGLTAGGPDAVEVLDDRAFSEREPGRQTGAPFSELQCYRRLKELVVSGYYTSQVAEASELKPTPMGPRRGDAPMDEIGRAWA